MHSQMSLQYTNQSIVFILSLIGAGFLGFSLLLTFKHDKLLHFATFFILTTEFFFIFRMRSIRQVTYLTFLVCTLCGGIGLEFLQHVVNKKRVFDPKDILFNLVGSILGLVLSVVYQSYHRGMHHIATEDIELQ